MKKQSLFYIIIGLIIVAGIVLLFLAKNLSNASGDGKLIFFYGNGCPHCANVEKFFADNDVKAKIQFAEKEVYNDQNNATEMGVYAQKCGLDLKTLGVPFLWTGSKCLVGDQPIIEFFQNRLQQPTK
jgi:glutaredoxin